MPNEFSNAQDAFTGICARSTNAENVVERVLSIRIRGDDAIIQSQCLSLLVNVRESSSKGIPLATVTFIRDDVGSRSVRGLEDVPVLFARTVINDDDFRRRICAMQFKDETRQSCVRLVSGD